MGAPTRAEAALATSSALNAPPVQATQRCACPLEASLSQMLVWPRSLTRPKMRMGGRVVVIHWAIPAAAA
eukprot:2312524-Heterocapsa_arctica.AAC.1